jgi:lipopolysaccharide transport system ATP-binding protein
MEPVVEFRNVSKTFILRHERPRSVRKRLKQWWQNRRQTGEDEPFLALNNLSFAVSKGKTVGIIGTNGSGKSTALKVMAGILQPDSGEVFVNGRLSALLGLGAGMHPDLTGRENVALNGSLMGLSNADMARLFPTIVDFSEIGRFIDMPVKHYSSGMYMRLGFSIATQIQPDILLLDEVLAVGDQNFQNKCFEHLYDMKRRGTSIVLVSHGLDIMRDMCDELIWLKDGRLMAYGDTEDVAAVYLHDLHSQQMNKRKGATFTPEDLEDEHRWGSREVEITEVRMVNQKGELTDTFRTGDTLHLELHYMAHKRIEDPMFGLAFMHADGSHITGPNNKFAGADFEPIEGKGVVHYTIENLPLLPGSYDLTVSAYDHTGTQAYDFHWRAYPFRVNSGRSREQYGILTLPASWRHEPRPAPDLIYSNGSPMK